MKRRKKRQSRKGLVVASATIFAVLGGAGIAEADTLQPTTDMTDVTLTDTNLEVDSSVTNEVTDLSENDAVNENTSFYTANGFNTSFNNHSGTSASQGNYDVYNKVIFIDAGHGGSDPGAVYGNTTEESLNLQMQELVRTQLESEGYQVVTARDTNSYVDLLDRSRMANGSQADIFVSIHFNASTNSAASGIETYYYQYYEEYPARINATYHEDVNRLNHSAVLASAIQAAVVSNTGGKNNGVRRQTFSVLRETTAPSVLLELGYMSNPSELARIKSPSYQRQLAQGIVSGIKQYYSYYGVSSSTPSRPSTPIVKPNDSIKNDKNTIPSAGTYTFTGSSAVRAEPRLSSPALAYYQKGQWVNYDKVIQADNHNWLSYISYGGNRRYVSIGQIETVKPKENTPSKPKEEKPNSTTPTTSTNKLPNSGTYTFIKTSYAKLEPKRRAIDIAYFEAGDKLTYDQVIQSEQETWLSYLSRSGRRRYVSIGAISSQTPEVKPQSPAPSKPNVAPTPPSKPKDVTPKPSVPTPPKDNPKPSVPAPKVEETPKKDEAKPSVNNLPNSGTYTFTKTSYAKLEPKRQAIDIAYFEAGDKLAYDQVIQSEQETWLSYLSRSGRRRYVSIGAISSQTPEVKPQSPAPSKPNVLPTPPSKPKDVTPKPSVPTPPKDNPKPSVPTPKVEETPKKDESKPSVNNLPNSGTYTFTKTSYAKLEPKRRAIDIAYFEAGDKLTYDQVIQSEQETWLSYLSRSGRRRYVSIGAISSQTPEVKPQSPSPSKPNVVPTPPSKPKDVTPKPSVPTPPKDNPKPSVPTPKVEEKPKKDEAKPSVNNLPNSGTYTFTKTSYAKLEPKRQAIDIAYFEAGDKLAYDQVIQSEQETWLSYLSRSGRRRYVSIGAISSQTPEAKPQSPAPSK